jgi:hypothetical protein
MVSSQQKPRRGQTELRAKACQLALVVRGLSFAVTRGQNLSLLVEESAAQRVV